MASYHIRKGNRLPAIEAYLSRDNSVADLTDATSVQLIYWPAGGGAALTKEAAFVGAKTAGRVKYAWGAGETDTPGVYHAYWQATYPSSVKESFPNAGHFEFEVTDEFG